MSDFAVAHIGIGGHTHRRTVSFEGGGGGVGEEIIQHRSIGKFHSIAVGVFTETDTVHNDQHHRTAAGGECRILFKSFEHNSIFFLENSSSVRKKFRQYQLR